MDRDTESIGGIEKPPLPTRELFRVTIVLDLAALVLSLFIHPGLPVFMLLYIGASKAYSYRGIRLKRFPVLGYLTVIIFQGALTFALVFFGSNPSAGLVIPWQGMAICAFLIGGFYPLTQVYQHRQDLADGVQTISYKLGYKGTFIFCAIVYALAFGLMAQFFIQNKAADKLLMVSIFFVPVIVYFSWWFNKVNKDNRAASYRNTMRMNWLAAFCTNTAFILLLMWRWFE